MKCAWEALIRILPGEIRADVDKLGKDTLQELRFRLDQPVMLVCSGGSRLLSLGSTIQMMEYVINMASRYSPWAAASLCKGYITAPGGHRIGVCGEVVLQNGSVTTIKNITSLCIRVARDFPGISKGVPYRKGNILIIGPPGCGKTTLLRDLIRSISDSGDRSVAVVDERGEIFPSGCMFSTGRNTDILTGCQKPQGLLMALKTMGPAWIAVDEITAQADCEALQEAAWCGVSLLATVHALDKRDLMLRKLFSPLLTAGIFQQVITLRRDKSFVAEKII